MNFKNLTDFYSYFKDEETCRKHLAQQRWNGVVTCPFCKSERIFVYKDGKRFRCAEKTCNKIFTVTVGTIYENSKIPLQKWFLAVYLITSSKKGISSLQLSRQLGVTQKTAWFINHRIREMLKDKAPQLLKEQVQIDETYVGGKEKNKHANKRKDDYKSEIKTAVIGIYEKDGKVVTQVTPWVTKQAAEKLLLDNVDTNAIMVTDGYLMYSGVGKIFKQHVVVNHSKGQYVDENKFHTNNIENFWSLLKRGIIGIYHFTSAKHLQRYCDEFAHRYNTRKIADNERFDTVICHSEGRLKYNDLIKDYKKYDSGEYQMPEWLME